MLEIRDFTVEYRQKPLGIDVNAPRFSWKLCSDQKNTKQQRYALSVTDETGDTVWESGPEESDQSVLLAYQGRPLKACTCYHVSLRIQDNHGQEAESKTSFETGLLQGTSFQAQWIAPRHPQKSGSCPVLTKEVSLEGKGIRKARIYASAHGLYEIAINQKKVGDALLTPGWTSYHHRLQYQTYDVTEELQGLSGPVKLQITLADGWYKGPFTWYEKENLYGDRLAALLELHIVYDDGSRQIAGTDDTWQAGEGPIRYSEIYHGETVDHTCKEAMKDTTEVLPFSKDVLLAQETPAVRVLHKLPVVKKFLTPKQELVLDFGQNISGFVSFHGQFPKGQKLTLRYVETLDRLGNVYTLNLRTAKAADTFVAAGGMERFQPHFTFHGFRYVQLLGFAEEQADPEAFTACAIHTDLPLTGSFACSDRRVNRLQKNIQWSQRDNFVDIPTDCPQRDERLGWTGDAQMFARTASYNMLTASFFTKWLHDLKADQTKEHGVPHVIPNVLEGTEGAAAWSDAATILPWTMYLCYGDKQLLQEQYQSMKDWVEYMRKKAGDTYLWQSGFQYGDWLGLDMEEFWPERVRFGLDFRENIDRIGATDIYLVASAFFAHSTEILRDTAKVLGYADDVKEYTSLLQHIKKAFQDEYVTPNGRIYGGTQTACVLALQFHLVEEKYRLKIMQTLIDNIHYHGDHLTTGFVGTPYLCHVLTDHGAHGLAAKLLLSDDYPSWLFEVKMGATTTWERWNSIHPDGTFDETGMNSLNHYAYGAVGDWLYRKVAGIDTLDAGYHHLLLRPRLTKGLSFAEGSLDTLYGIVKSRWQLHGRHVQLDFTIPANCQADVYLPGTKNNKKLSLGSGQYHYDYEAEGDLETIYEELS